jgi:hypothetical protein
MPACRPWFDSPCVLTLSLTGIGSPNSGTRRDARAQLEVASARLLEHALRLERDEGAERLAARHRASSASA